MTQIELDGWAAVVGQPDAVARLRAAVDNPVHAYLFVGPVGSGKRAAVRAFAAELLAADETDPAAAERHRRLALAEHHPDLVFVEPAGAVFRGSADSAGDEGEAQVVIREAYRSPVEASRKVVVAVDFHTANPRAVGALLKTLEEPPGRAVLVLLAEQVPDDQAAIASRCLRVDFPALGDDVLRDALVADGIDAELAADIVTLAEGDLARARVLATDERLKLRVDAWRAVPLRLTGRGAAATDAVDDLRAMIDDAIAPLVAAHDAELARFDDEAERYGIKGAGGRRTALIARHKREQRRFRTAEVRSGLAVLGRAYRDELVVSARPEPLVAACTAVQKAAEALVVNPNEELLLCALFSSLPPLAP